MKKLTIFLLIFSGLTAQPENRSRGFGLNMGTKGTGLVYSELWDIRTGIQAGIEGRIFDIKNEGEMPVYNYYTQTYQNVDDKALILFPIMAAFKYFPFEGKIANNFSPFLSIKLGPIFSLDGDEDHSSFSDRWGNASTGITAGGNLALGVDFRYMSGSVISVSMGYDFFPMGKEVDGQTHYNGLLLNLSFSRAR